MRTIHHILVPIDFGASSLAALDFAVTLAGKFDATITLVHASWIPPLAYSAYAEGLSWPVDEMARGAEKEFHSLLTKTQKVWPRTDGLMLLGDAWQVILDTTTASKADLVVMGTHGRRGISRAFMGSVAERVVRLASVPVVTISERADEGARRAAPVNEAPSIC